MPCKENRDEGCKNVDVGDAAAHCHAELFERAHELHAFAQFFYDACCQMRTARNQAAFKEGAFEKIARYKRNRRDSA